MTAKFTPGPWEFKDRVGAGIQIEAQAGKIAPLCNLFEPPRFEEDKRIFLFTLREEHHGTPIQFGDERWVQFEPYGWHEMQIANANLIAAAPEMYEALQSLAFDVLDGGPLELVKRILAKAEGRQS